MKYVAVDTETTGVHLYGDGSRYGSYPARPFVVSMCWEDGTTNYWRWEVDPLTRRVRYESDVKAVSQVRKVLDDTSVVKVFHNADFDLRMLKAAGMPVRGQYEDTAIAAIVCTGGGEIAYGLKPLCKKWFEFSDSDQKELTKSVHKARREAKKRGWKIADRVHGKSSYLADYWLGDPELCKKYAIQDVERTMLLWLFLKPKIDAEPDYQKTYKREMDLLPEVIRMEEVGVRINPKHVNRLIVLYREYMEQQLKTIADAGYPNYNPKSTKQTRKIFVEDRGYQPLKLTPKGSPSVSGDFMKYLAEKIGDPLARAALEYTNAKLGLSNFLEPYKRLYVIEDGQAILHPNYRSTGARTGRISCTEPNLMNVASEHTGRTKSQIKLRPRECFIPRKGRLWYLPDYSQIEVWLFAFMAQSQTMLDALMSGQDFHGKIARDVWGGMEDYQERHEYYRKCAKMVLFSKLYGGGTKKRAQLLECSFEEAKAFDIRYNRAMPDIDRFIRRTENKARKDGYIVNPFGRRYIVDAGFEYKLVNYLIQGTAADVMKLGMKAVGNLRDNRWPEITPLMTIHDELVVELPYKYHSKRLMRELMDAMISPSYLIKGLPRPLPVHIKYVTKNWAEPVEVKL